MGWCLLAITSVASADCPATSIAQFSILDFFLAGILPSFLAIFLFLTSSFHLDYCAYVPFLGVFTLAFVRKNIIFKTAARSCHAWVTGGSCLRLLPCMPAAPRRSESHRQPKQWEPLLQTGKAEGGWVDLCQD